MKVGIDVSPLRQTRAGTARYLLGMLPHLEQLADVEPLAWGGAGKVATVVRDAWWYPLGLPRRARRLDVLHCPSFRAPPRAQVPLVVNIHDLAVLRHPETFNRWTRTYSRVFVPRVARGAQRVIALSEFMKRELVEVLGLDANKIRVVPPAVDEPFVPDGPSAEGDYVLAVGTLEPRKNLPRLAQAARLAGVELRVVGARGWGNVDLGGEGVRWLGFVPDDELAALYRGARCLVYASLYEGFGIPVAEALACGCPIVTSRGSAMEEIAGDDATYADPTSVESIREGVAGAKPPSARRVASWPEVAARTQAVYEELA
jgi:glycosyltransferase involved in cell wall biosynthesis